PAGGYGPPLRIGFPVFRPHFSFLLAPPCAARRKDKTMILTILSQDAHSTTVVWPAVAGAARYALLWSDRFSDTVRFKTAAETAETSFRFVRSTHIPYYLKARAFDAAGALLAESEVLTTPVARVLRPQLEPLGRGLVALPAKNGVFLSWRLLRGEVSGYSATGLTGTDFILYKNGEKLAAVTDSTNYLDPAGTAGDAYAVAPVVDGREGAPCAAVRPWANGYLDLPLQKPADGVTPAGDAFTYHANDM